MMVGKQTTWVLGWGGLLLFLLSGCAGSSPQVGEAETALSDGKYQEALSRLEAAIEQDSADTGAYILRAKVLRRMADSTGAPDEYKELYRRARQAEEEALVFDPGLSEDVRATRRRVYDREIRQGERAYNRANKLDDDERYERAIAHFGAAGVTRADSARPVLNEAFARLRVDQRKKAIPVLEEYVERADTVSRVAYKLLGDLYVADGQHDRAVDLLGPAIKRHPGDQELQGLWLNAHNRAGEADRALDLYRQEVQEHPENATYRYNYGSLLLKAKRYGDAIDQLTTAVELRPDHLESQYNLGAAYVNAALARDDSIAVLEEEGGSTTPADSVRNRTEQIEALVQKRNSLFEKAIPPLERARKIGDSASTIRRDACRALLVAYVQTNRPNRAAQVEECTGFAQADL